MDVWRTVAVLVRRWYVTVPAILVTLGLAAAAYAAVPVQYTSDAVLVLTTPLSGGTDQTQDPPTDPNLTGDERSHLLTNPLLNFDRGLSLAASIVIQQLSSPEVRRGLGVTPEGETDYEVTNGSTNPELLESGPFVFIKGTGPTARAAQDMTEEVAALANQILADRQAALGAPAATYISVQVVVPPTGGERLEGSPMRAAAAVGALAVLAGLAAAYGTESLMAHRRGRRGHDEDGSPDTRARTEATSLLEPVVGSR